MAKMVSKRLLDEIRFKSDIAEVIGSYFEIKRAGSAFRALCPFHKEKTPSFHVNPQRQIFHCFGCGAGGDVFRFVMQYENMDFTTAVKMLAQRAGVKVDLEESEESALDKNILYKLLSDITNYYHRELLESKSAEPARLYLQKRKLTDDIVKEFLIGCAPDSWDAVLNEAQKKKYSIDQLEAAGLIIKSSKPESKSKYYDRFRDRLMFPIYDEQGRVIGFSGRTFEDKPESAKYVNSPDTALFHKSRVLYALDKARRNIAESREAVICEGQIDVIRCHSAGFKNAVAAQGTAFTEDHVRILKRYADSVCLVFDPDKAGQDAAIRAAAIFLSAGLAIRIALLPPKEDPDAFILKHGTKAFQEILNKAQSAVNFQISVLSEREDVKSEIGVMRIAKAVLQTISHSPNAVQRAKLVQEAAERLNIQASALQDDLKHILRQSYQNTSVSSAEPESVKEETAKMPVEEEQLCEHLAHMIDHPEMVALIKKYLPLEMISHPLCRQAAKASIESAEKGSNIHDILNECDSSDEVHKFAARVIEATIKVNEAEMSREDAVKDLILRLWKRKLKLDLPEIDRRMSSEEGKNDENLRNRRHQISHDLQALKNWKDGSTIIEMKLSE